SNPKQRADLRMNARYLRVAGIVKNTDARRAIRRYLNDLGRDRGILEHAIAALSTKATSSFSSDFNRETALKNIENLQRFAESEKRLGLGNYGFEVTSANQPELMLGGVPVSVQLDWFVVASPDDEEQPRTGGALLQLTKGGPLPETAKKED